MFYTAKLKSLINCSIISLCLSACGSGGEGTDEDSSNGNQNSSVPHIASHNAGQSCMSASCHDGSGSADKFTVAGTLYKSGNSPQTSATVRLYVHGTNTLSMTLTPDANGNFYTSEPVDGLVDGSGNLVTGVDVEVETANSIYTMPGLISNGGCNGCHGAGNGKIVVN